MVAGPLTRCVGGWPPFLWANFVELRYGEVLRIPLLQGTSVNKGPSRGTGPRFNKGTPRRVRSRHNIGFVPTTVLAYLQGSIPLATGRSYAYNTSRV